MDDTKPTNEGEQQPIRIEATLIAKLNLADFQNAVPMLRDLSIVNDTVAEIKSLELRVESVPAFLNRSGNAVAGSGRAVGPVWRGRYRLERRLPGRSGAPGTARQHRPGNRWRIVNDFPGCCRRSPLFGGIVALTNSYAAGFMVTGLPTAACGLALLLARRRFGVKRSGVAATSLLDTMPTSTEAERDNVKS